MWYYDVNTESLLNIDKSTGHGSEALKYSKLDSGIRPLWGFKVENSWDAIALRFAVSDKC